MEGISDIKIVGVDERRPPIIRKEPYIDVYFKLSHQAPVDWCKAFNSLTSKLASAPKIKEKDGLFIETWVRNADEIIPLLELLKGKIVECTKLYIEEIEAASNKNNAANASAMSETGEQGRLNQIIASLNFD